MSDLIIVARVEARPGREAALVAAQAELVKSVRAQPGCLAYDLFEDNEQPGRVIFFERWASQKEWQRHMAGAHMDRFRSSAGHYIGNFELMQMHQVA